MAIKVIQSNTTSIDTNKLIVSEADRVLSEIPDNIIMPRASIQWQNVSLKIAEISTQTSGSIGIFNTMIANTIYTKGYTAILSSGITTRQTIVDIITGVSGIVTNIVGASVVGVGTNSIIVTADGKEYIFNFDNMSASFRPVLGGFEGISPLQTQGNYIGDISYTDRGWDAAKSQMTLLTPMQTISRGIGIRFKDSLKVEQVASTGIESAAFHNRAVVTYVKR